VLGRDAPSAEEDPDPAWVSDPLEFLG